jgi:zinc protease
VVRSPAFPIDQVERVRAETLDALRSRRDEPAHLADDVVLLELFGEAHPYGLPAFGNEAGIRGVTREELAAFHGAHYRPGRAFLVAAGEFEPEELRGLLEDAFREWSGEPAPLAYPPTPTLPKRAGELLARPWRDAAQSEIRIGGMGLPRLHPDWVPAGVTNFLLGGSTITGRLGANLREDKGWTYGVRSSFSAGVVPGGWLAETAVDVEVTAAAVEEMLGEMRRLASEPVGEQELRRAKDALMLSLPRIFETPAGVASRLATVEAYGLPHDWWERFPAAVEAVTAAQVRAMAATHFHPDKLVRVVVGAEAGAER